MLPLARRRSRHGPAPPLAQAISPNLARSWPRAARRRPGCNPAPPAAARTPPFGPARGDAAPEWPRKSGGPAAPIARSRHRTLQRRARGGRRSGVRTGSRARRAEPPASWRSRGSPPARPPHAPPRSRLRPSCRFPAGRIEALPAHARQGLRPNSARFGLSLAPHPRMAGASLPPALAPPDTCRSRRRRPRE